VYSKKKQPVLIEARTIAVGAVGDIASTIRGRPINQTDLSQKDILQKIHRIFDLLEVEFSEISLVDLTKALGCIFRGKADSSEENVLRVFHRFFEVANMEFLECETVTEVLIATGCVFCGLTAVSPTIAGRTDSGNRWAPRRPHRRSK
jgi:hypothetical protein